jgi:hypothetical protein
MTNKELQEELKKYPDDADIVFIDEGWVAITDIKYNQFLEHLELRNDTKTIYE